MNSEQNSIDWNKSWRTHDTISRNFICLMLKQTQIEVMVDKMFYLFYVYTCTCIDHVDQINVHSTKYTHYIR